MTENCEGFKRRSSPFNHGGGPNLGNGNILLNDSCAGSYGTDNVLPDIMGTPQ
jgi:hypothetical protein